jgi:hypothetical protein
MAFVVEDGTGTNPLANAYVSVAYSDTYFSDRGITEWTTYSDAEKQGAIIYSTGYFDSTVEWYGTIKSTTQPLGWPRQGTWYDSNGRQIVADGIPTQLKNAVCELAFQHLQNNLNDTTSEGVSSEKIGSSTITYAGGSSSKSYSFLKNMVKALGTTGSSSNATVYRN